jgi:hypothetical protein
MRARCEAVNLPPFFAAATTRASAASAATTRARSAFTFALRAARCAAYFALCWRRFSVFGPGFFV